MCAVQVNGFEVYDPEEAVLLFLEQDQDISLTVARKMKVRLTTIICRYAHSLLPSLPYHLNLVTTRCVIILYVTTCSEL